MCGSDHTLHFNYFSYYFVKSKLFISLIDVFIVSRISAEVDAEEQHKLTLLRAAEQHKLILLRAAEVEAERVVHQEMLRVAAAVSSSS